MAATPYTYCLPHIGIASNRSIRETSDSPNCRRFYLYNIAELHLHLLFFLVLVVEVEGQLYDLPEVVLDVDVDGLLVGRSGGVVEAEHLAFERIAVVGQEYRAVVHTERSLAVGQEYRAPS